MCAVRSSEFVAKRSISIKISQINFVFKFSETMNSSHVTCFAIFICLCLVNVNALVEPFDPNNDIYFELYTRENRDNFQVIKNVQQIGNTPFDPIRRTRIFVHGFLSGRRIIQQYAQAFLQAGNYNFIAVNWSAGAVTLAYPIARARVEVVRK